MELWWTAVTAPHAISGGAANTGCLPTFCLLVCLLRLCVFRVCCVCCVRCVCCAPSARAHHQSLKTKDKCGDTDPWLLGAARRTLFRLSAIRVLPSRSILTFLNRELPIHCLASNSLHIGHNSYRGEMLTATKFLRQKI